MSAVDWANAVCALDVRTGERLAVQVDASFAKKEGVQFVRLPRNAWTGDGSAGTWAFDSDGLATAGKSPDGYNGRFRVENAK